MKHYPLPTDDFAPEAIVLANGDFPRAGLALSVVERWMNGSINAPLACCDGAVNKLLSHTDRLPSIVVGDLDSLSLEMREHLGERAHRIAEQETNDLTKTINYTVHTLGYSSITLIGASGGREDHLLGNLALLPTYAGLVSELLMLTDYGHFRLITEPSTLEVRVGQALSVFNFDQTPITMRGVEWPLEQYTLPQLWCGTLNRTTSPLVHIRTTSPILVYLVD